MPVDLSFVKGLSRRIADLATRALLIGVAANACLAPRARAQSSLNCNLLANVDSLPGRGSSCWGYVDPSTGNEYAIYGYQFGTAIYNIVDPAAPYLTGVIPGPVSNWREMKVYRNYCYVGTEGGGGLQIIDLAAPEAPTLAATYTGAGLSTIHSVTVDSVSARLYANGANGGTRILSLANPLVPVEVGNLVAPYVHDSYARGDTLYAACIAVGTMLVLDAGNPAALDTLVQFSTESVRPHNAWPSEDGRSLFVADEIAGGRVTSWDISDLSDPVQIDGFTADPAGDAHNVHVRGDLAFVAHYTSGLQILDVSAPDNMVRVGFYDTYPDAGGPFAGAWGVFNYFPSGTIVVSDITYGMFLIDYVPNSLVLEGVVTDAATGAPLANAEVRVVQTGESDSTDVSGRYAMTHPAGAYAARARAFGYDSVTVTQTLVAGDTAIIDFALPPLTSGSVSGVFRYAPGAGIANAIVRIEGTPLVDTTQAGGAYAFPLAPVGAHVVTLDHWTAIPESANADVTVAPGNAVADFTHDAVAFAFNMEDTSAAGWLVNVGGADNATAGVWTRVDPIGTGGGNVQPEDDYTRDPLAKCWVTGQGTQGGGIGDDDLDGGLTTLYSPVMNVAGLTEPTIEYFSWWYTGTGAPDWFLAQVSSNAGLTWATVDSSAGIAASWKHVRFRVASYVTPTPQVRMRFRANDGGPSSTVEAAIDDFRVWGRSVVAVGDTYDPAASSGAPAAFALEQNWPNPFGRRTEIRFSLPTSRAATLAVFSPDGRRVATLIDGHLPAGGHAISWDGRDAAGRAVASGVYLLRLDSRSETAVRKLLITR